MIAVVDYNSGNVTSVANALAKLGVEHSVTSNPNVIRSAEKIIFPGQGRAKQTMDTISSLGLDTVIRESEKPFLGICIGMQLLLEFSEEDNCKGLGIIPGRVRKFKLEDDLKIPLVGWNSVEINDDPIFKDIPDNTYFYFVNSYYANPLPEYIIGTTPYGVKFASVVKRNNFYGTQFHPEKSGPPGIQLLKNFCEL